MPPQSPSASQPGRSSGSQGAGLGADPRTGAGSSSRTAGPASPAKPPPPHPSPRPPSSPAGQQPSHTPEPARLTVGESRRSADEEGRRWCEKVTAPLTNSGGSPVTSGTVTFGTHVIDLLGIDWATLTSSQPLPVPIGAGATVEAAWTVCVDAWRVPWGMRVETRDVKVEWG
ncbi:hypothetical protein [Streptomyces sp. XH2]|uniref:hypothetical protein n=1 Tax=Streptomyces sp. XH2 TaxID=3412483 RepID=UPI003C7EC528